MKIRGVVLVWFLLLLAMAPAALSQSTEIPDAPFFTLTINIPAGEQRTAEEAFSANTSACDPIGTRYVMVVKNGNPDGTGMVQTGAAGVNGLDYVGDALFDGAPEVTTDVPLLPGNVAVMQGQAPPGSAAVLTMEIWRKPVTATPFHQTYSFPLSMANKKYTASFAVTDPSIPAMLVVTRIGGMQTADQFSIKLNGTNYFSRTNFSLPVQTLVAFVNLQLSNSVQIDAVAATQSSEVTVRVVQHAPDNTLPAINFTGTIPIAVATNTFTFTGNVTDANRVSVLKVNGTKVNHSSSSGAFTTTVPLTEGLNEFTFVAYDCAGNGVQVVKTVFSSLNPPVVTVTSPLPNAFVKGSLTVTGTVTNEGIGSPTVKVNGTTASVSGTNWTADITLPAPDGAKTITVVATDLLLRSSTVTVPVTLDATPPTITASYHPALSFNGWGPGGLTLSFNCEDSGSGIAECTEPAQFDITDLYLVEGAATDRAGNTAVIGVAVRVDADAPQLTLAPIAPVVNQASLTITGTVSDEHSGLLGISCGQVAATLSGNTFTCTVSLLPGDNELLVVATDRVGNTAHAAAGVELDERPPTVSITEPAEGSVVNGATVVVRGTISDNDDVAIVRVNGANIAFEAGEFSEQVALVPGNNTITVHAIDRGGNVATDEVIVNRYIVPVVIITSPTDLAVLRETTVTITGTVSDPAATVTVNDVTASTSNGNFTAAGVPLAQGRTVITANAVSPSGGTATTSINLYRDSIPPRLEVYAPENDATVYTSPVSISGMVDDIVVGTINSQQMRVKVNGVDAEVANRAFLLRNVVLSAGLNTFSISAIDEGGNTTVVSYRLTYVPAPPQPHLEIVSGNGQTGAIGTTLAAPLVVRAVAPNGAPVVGSMLTFAIDNNDGTVSDGTTTASSVTVPTDAQGRAHVQWTLGNRAGAGNHRLQVRGAGYAAPLEATAAATTGNPHLIVVDTGNNQFGIVNDALPRPLIAIVVDAGNNRLANVPVTFTVSSGGGNFDGQSSILVATDSDGRAIVRPTLGAEPGEDNNVFSATTPGVTANATFVASGRAAGPPASTRITGVILDNTSIPIAGVTVRIDGTQIMVQSDPYGQFEINGAPVGYVKLFIDGSTAQRAGIWPTLEYALYTLPGVENSVGMPIYLVQLDTARGLFVDDTTGGTLTLPELPGFALEVKAGSATFPGGGRTGTVSATLVHADRIPMAPGFGQQPKFIITIQPPGTHFDPPARLTLPNTDGLAPGASTEMYSFDHDLGQFVTIGNATVSSDGSTMTSDPGVGIIKGGWHAGGDPVPGGGGADCGECSEASGDVCIISAAMEGGQCRDDGIPCTIDWCVGGVETHVEANFRIELESPADNFMIQPEPRMPVIQARAVITNIPANVVQMAQVRFRWTAKIEYRTPLGGTQKLEIGPVIAGTTWTPNFPSIQGGNLTVKATLVRLGRSCKEATAPPQEILGLNPPRSEVIGIINSSFVLEANQRYSRLMTCRESGMMQFREADHREGRKGEPVYHRDTGGTVGVGMKQLTNPAAPDHTYWHWRNNLADGISRFREKLRDAIRYSEEKHREEGAPLLTDDQLIIEGVQRYNTGAYWKWRDGKWEPDPRNPNGTVNRYLLDVQASTHCGG